MLSNIDLHFPTCIYTRPGVNKNELEFYKQEIKKLHQTKALYRDSKDKIYIGHDVMDIHLHPSFKSLTAQILIHTHEFASYLGYNDECCQGLQMIHMWFNISHKGSSLSKHIHPHSLFSGVYYIKAAPGDKIIFHEKDDMTFPPQKPNEFSKDTVSYDCESGKLFLFKSDLNHSTPLQENQEKIALAFKISPT